MNKKRLNFSFILIFSFFFVVNCNCQLVKRVVIDAGHGGKDYGAIGKKSNEKDITLAIALKTGEYIEENFKDVKVIYTRKSDKFVELYQRAKIANDTKADLFISIHCNSTKSVLPNGAETFVMGLHRTNANLAVAQTENAAILLEDDYEMVYDGFNPNSPEGYIFFSMLQNTFIENSLHFASTIQNNLVNATNFIDRGVKQAGFLVLYKTMMPSVLVEVGFISNEEEEKFIMSETGQETIAKSIFNAFSSYKTSLSNNTSISTSTKINNTTIKEKEIKSNTPNTEDVGVSLDTDTNKASDLVCFKVQFFISKIKIPATSPRFNGINDVDFYIQDNMYKYTTGAENTLKEAEKLRTHLINIGFKDAFVIAFKNNERISISNAKELIKSD